MGVKVKFYSTLREAAGVSELEIDPPPKTVRELLNVLNQKLGPKFADLVKEQDSPTVRSQLIILVNGHSVKLLKGLDTPLAEGDLVTGDIITIMETVGGG